MFGRKLEANIAVEGMHCNHCKAKVEKAIGSVKGVKKYEVRLESADAFVIYEEGKTTPEKIAEAISAIGFEARVK